MHPDVIMLLTAIVGFLTAVVAGFIVVWREIRGVHKLINSRLDELLALTRKSAHANGVLEGRDRPSSRE